MRAPVRLLVSAATVLLGAASLACGSEPAAAPDPTSTPPPPTAPEPPPEPPTATAEACARVIVVAWQGAAHAADTVTRTQPEARERAEQLLTRLESGEDFATLARTESDAASSGPRGGLLGTYTRDDWPAAHAPIADPIFALTVGQTSQVLEAPYGWVVAQRCPVEHVHTRHILVRFAGARNAPDDVTRTREEAHARASELLALAQSPGADFAALAREHSEDASAERGGDVGTTGRGRLAPAYEEAAYALAESAIAGPIETEFGFHVIQRLPE
jgi:peptidyl-prolyl cis-trans isomerase SurA